MKSTVFAKSLVWMAALMMIVGIATSTTHAQSADAPVEPIKVRMTMFHVTLSDDHKFGMDITATDMEEVMRSGGTVALGRKLDEYGKAAVAAQVDAQGIVGNSIRGFSGAEMPYVTTIMGTGSNSERVQSQTQQTVTGGVTMEMKFENRSNATIAQYSVSYDGAYVKEVENASLIARLRANINGTIVLSADEKVHIMRQTHTTDGVPQELVFVVEIL